MNEIAHLQNTEPQLRRLAAQRWLYGKAKRIFLVYVFVAGPLAVCLKLLEPILGKTPYVAAWGLIASLAEVLWLSPWQKALRETAAKIQEAFDCEVLGIAWQELKVGKPVDGEVVVAAARSYARVELRNGPLQDWYPPAVSELSLASGRILCQRVNCWWDGSQRARYANIVQVVLAVIVVAAVASGFALRMTLAEFLLGVGAPFSPLMLLCIRQAVENREATVRLDKLKDHATKLWTSVLSNPSAKNLADASRTLQDEIFDHRKRNPPVLDFIYNRLRLEHEVNMTDAAEEDVRRAKEAGPHRAENGGR